MDGQQQQDPPLTYQDPQAYILYLKTKRVPASQIAMMVQERFGPGKSPEQRAKEAADAEAKGSMASGLGSVAGSLGSAYLMSKLAGGGAAAASGTGVMGGTSGIMSAMQGAGMLSSGGAAGAGGGTVGAMPTLAAAAPYAAAVAAAIAAGVNYNRMAKKTKVMGTGEALREAAKDPVNYLIPSGFIGAAFGDKDRYLTEHRRLLELQEKGINVPESMLAATRLSRGRSKEELIEEAKRTGGNVKFAESRNEADLRPEDIWGYSSFFKKFGNDWLGGLTEAQRRGIAQKALDAGAVREHHGTIDVDWGKVELPEDLTKIGPKQGPVIPRPKKGEVARVSPGMYRNDQGKLVQADTMRQALERSYNNTKGKGK